MKKFMLAMAASLAMVAGLLFVTTPGAVAATQYTNQKCVDGDNTRVPGQFCVRATWHYQADGSGIIIDKVEVWLSGCWQSSSWKSPAANYGITLRYANGDPQGWSKQGQELYVSEGTGCKDTFWPDTASYLTQYFTFSGKYGTTVDGDSNFSNTLGLG